MHPPAAKTIAWVEHLFLHYLFAHTYLFSLNIMSSNLLSACNKDDKLRDHQQLTFEFFSRFCLLICPPSPLYLTDRFPFQFFFSFFDHIKSNNTKPFFFAINNSSCLTLHHKIFHFILNHCCETETFMYIKTFSARKLL